DPAPVIAKASEQSLCAHEHMPLQIRRRNLIRRARENAAHFSPRGGRPRRIQASGRAREVVIRWWWRLARINLGRLRRLFLARFAFGLGRWLLRAWRGLRRTGADA